MARWTTPRSHKDPGHKPATTASGYRPISLTLPNAYLRILDEEAVLTRQERSKFLRMLLHGRSGTMSIARTAPPAIYQASRKDLAERTRWTWFLTPADGEFLDEQSLLLGGMPATVWVVREIHRWLGAPDAWTEIKPGRFELRGTAGQAAPGASGATRADR